MIRRYLLLGVAALAAALLAGRAARIGHDEGAPRREESRPAVTMTLAVYDDRVMSDPASVACGSRVALTVTNACSTAVRLRLAGYEDRVDTGALEPDGTRQLVFVADRPGERFAWIIGETPMGRLDVTGSHLVEGHR